MIQLIATEEISQIPDGNMNLSFIPTEVKIIMGTPTFLASGVPGDFMKGYKIPFDYFKKDTDANGRKSWAHVPRSVEDKILLETDINTLAATVYSMNPPLASAPDFTQTNGKFYAGTLFEMAQTLGLTTDKFVLFTDLILNDITVVGASGSFTASWNKLNYVDNYVLEYKLDSNANWTTVTLDNMVAPDNVCSHEVTGLAAGDYEVRTKAKDAFREGDFSLISMVTVSA